MRDDSRGRLAERLDPAAFIAPKTQDAAPD